MEDDLGLAWVIALTSCIVSGMLAEIIGKRKAIVKIAIRVLINLTIEECAFNVYHEKFWEIYIFEKPNPYEETALKFEERRNMGSTGGRLRNSSGLTNNKMLISHLRIVSIRYLESAYKGTDF